MAEGTSAPLDPQQLLEHTFTSVRRGFDQAEVRQLLLQVATELQVARARELQLEAALADAETRAAAVDPLDPQYLTKLLGDETARILDAARTAATEIRIRADEAARRLLDEAKAEAEMLTVEILERARAEARAIAPEGVDRSAADAAGVPALQAEIDTAVEPEAEPAAESMREPAVAAAPDAMSRPRRRRSDPGRTSELFTRLREAEGPAPVAPKPRSESKPATASRPKPKPKPKPKAKVKPTRVAVPPPALAPAPEPSPIPDAVRAVVDLSGVARRIKRELSDDQNALLAASTAPKSRVAGSAGSVDEGQTELSMERYVSLIRASLAETVEADAPIIEECALVAAHGLIAPLRAEIGQVNATTADDPAGRAEALRACFREVRSHGVDAVLASVAGLLAGADAAAEG